MSKTTVDLDIETYCELDLKKVGVYAYSEHPSFEVLMCGYSIDGGPAQVVVGHDNVREALGEILTSPRYLKVAFNSQFDRVCLSRLVQPQGHYLDADQWEDPMIWAAHHGYPMSLERLAASLGGEQKDSAGTTLINMFSKPRRGQRVYPDQRPDEWQSFVDYCRQDVDTLVSVRQQLPAWPTPFEREVWVLDQRINDRGIQTDLEMARLAVARDEQLRTQFEAEICELLGIGNANSVVQVRAALKEAGLDLPNLRAETVAAALQREDLTDVQRRALELRTEIALSASKKYQALINQTSKHDDRLRGSFRHFGAHTGRWSGRGVQLQNLPRDQHDRPEAAILDLKLGAPLGAQELKELIRASLVGPFAVADYAAIEARVLAWVADERWAIEAFEAERDIYVETAKRMGGLTRQQGKVAVLALGYQGGVNSLRSMGAQGTDEELNLLKVQWRKANRRIVRLWRDLENAFEAGGEAGNLRVEAQGGVRRLVLPSGRAITYRGVKWETWFTSDEKGKRHRHSGWRFNGRLGRADTYGGRLAENAVQAIARDLLADTLVKLENEWGEHVAGHVHDEIIVENRRPATLPTTISVMEEGPRWAKGLPLGAEGFVCERYRKG